MYSRKQKDSKTVKRKNIVNNGFSELPLLVQNNSLCNFQGYDIDVLMKELLMPLPKN